MRSGRDLSIYVFVSAWHSLFNMPESKSKQESGKLIHDEEEFVESVVATYRIIRVDTPATRGMHRYQVIMTRQLKYLNWLSQLSNIFVMIVMLS